MKCPFCKVDDDKVVDSRASSDGFAIRRRRECVACGRRYTTYERIEESPLRVVKKDDRREPFDRRKILTGLIKACEKRPVSLDVLEAVTETIEGKVLEAFDREVPSTYLGTLVMSELKKVDQVAYVRFASVYRDFKTVQEFLDELRPMVEGRAAEGRAAEGRAAEGRAAEDKSHDGKPGEPESGPRRERPKA